MTRYGATRIGLLGMFEKSRTLKISGKWQKALSDPGPVSLRGSASTTTRPNSHKALVKAGYVKFDVYLPTLEQRMRA